MGAVRIGERERGEVEVRIFAVILVFVFWEVEIKVCFFVWLGFSCFFFLIRFSFVSYGGIVFEF